MLGWHANSTVEQSAATIAIAINADQDEVIFTSGATEANNLAILGLARRGPPSRRRVPVSAIEHKCVLAAAHSLRSLGYCVESIRVTDGGVLDLDELKSRLRDDVLLVAVMAVNNEVGTVQDIPEIARLCAQVGVYLHTDAAQALACGPIDVAAWQVTTLSLSGHKVYGPKGIGALYIRRDAQSRIEPIFFGGGQQNGLRSGTVPVALVVGLSASVQLMASQEAPEERSRLSAMRDELIDSLCSIGGVTLNGQPPHKRHPGNANLRFDGIDGRDLVAAVQPRVAASTSSACSTGIPEPSYVLRAMGLTNSEASSSVRFGLGRFTTHDQITASLHIIHQAVSSLRAAAGMDSS